VCQQLRPPAHILHHFALLRHTTLEQQLCNKIETTEVTHDDEGVDGDTGYLILVIYLELLFHWNSTKLMPKNVNKTSVNNIIFDVLLLFLVLIQTSAVCHYENGHLSDFAYLSYFGDDVKRKGNLECICESPFLSDCLSEL